jgi:2-keto-4-pentenoate hydratase/2-oxohepta-3-ene-1,7-dioic acid hydratase in catechol pathway
MHFKIYDQLEYISKYITLEPGDIIMTGTPEGSGPVEEGDLL